MEKIEKNWKMDGKIVLKRLTYLLTYLLTDLLTYLLTYLVTTLGK